MKEAMRLDPFHSAGKKNPRIPLPQGERIRAESGIAVGVILFVIAILAVVAIAFSASGNFVGSTLTIDRISKELRSQADLIRAKINECYMNTSNIDHSGGDYYPTTNFPPSTGSGTAVASLTCPTYGSGVDNLWSGQSPATLPTPPTGFDSWYYVNAGDSGGRCIRIQPLAGFVNDNGVRQGIVETAAGFSGLEHVYDPNSSSQRFILWITKPTGPASADCSS